MTMMATTTAAEVRESVKVWVRDAIESGDISRDDEDAQADWVHETADGCEFVIYYRHSRGLFGEGALDEWLDEAKEYRDGESFDSVDDWLTAATYLLVRDELESAISEAFEPAGL